MGRTIIVLGAGLSGLLTAKRLLDQGHNVTILEARARIGGRIYTKHAALDTPVEMGATWFGKKHIHLTSLLDELSVGYYEQHTEGKAYFEPFSLAPPQQIDIPTQLPSYRIIGGSCSLINALQVSITKEKIKLNTIIGAIDFSNDKIRVQSNKESFEADLVVSTLPPALLLMSVKMHPEIDPNLKKVALATHTWMQDAIKTAIIFDKPFWRNNNGSGTLFSNVGPVSEFYDHSDHKVEKYALCGFVNSGYVAVDKAQRQKKVLTQLERFYGASIHSYIEYVEHIWPADPNTKHIKMPPIFPHQNNGHPIYQKPWFDNRFWISGSETASQFPGYMDGAIESAENVVQQITAVV